MWIRKFVSLPCRSFYMKTNKQKKKLVSINSAWHTKNIMRKLWIGKCSIIADMLFTSQFGCFGILPAVRRSRNKKHFPHSKRLHSLSFDIFPLNINHMTSTNISSYSPFMAFFVSNRFTPYFAFWFWSLDKEDYSYEHFKFPAVWTHL